MSTREFPVLDLSNAHLNWSSVTGNPDLCTSGESCDDATTTTTTTTNTNALDL